jgi:DNA-directed RNA polymerase subunit K/omega
LGLRTKQLNDGAEPFYEVPSNIIDSYYIAEQELEKKLLPFIIKRPVNKNCEYWKLADLKIL